MPEDQKNRFVSRNRIAQTGPNNTKNIPNNGFQYIDIDESDELYTYENNQYELPNTENSVNDRED